MLARRFLLACAIALASVGTAYTQPIRRVPAEFEPQAENPTHWTWDFGDGESSDTQSPVHSYVEEGVYTVSLTASSASGSDTIVRTEYLSVPEPDTLVQLCLGCAFLFALNNRRETGGSEACRG